MGHRTTTVCDGAGCTAEHDNPVSRGGAVVARQQRGWGTLHLSDEKTGYPCSHDLCPACIQKIVELLGLKTGEEMLREHSARLHMGFPDLASAIDTAPSLPPRMCETCNEPYVGDSCYFCPPAPKDNEP